MAKIKFSFARGGHFTAKVMLDKAPKTWEAIRKQLPLTIKAYNARWTGRETHTKLDLPNKPPRENQILNAGLVDQSEWPFLEEVGLRTWQQGGEDCTITVAED